MSRSKKLVRQQFRAAVFARDGYACRGCGHAAGHARAGAELDAHHITDRSAMPGGGYVPENGISLCAACHRKAEAFHSGEPMPDGFSPDELYQRVGSSEQVARAAAERHTPG